MQNFRVRQHEPVQVPDWMLDALQENELLASILVQRGIDTPQKFQTFLDPDLYQPTDPGEFPNMLAGVELILQAIEEEQTICIYGDYDVDGITSTTILVHGLRRLGAKVRYHLPHRFTEGYGMNERVVQKLAEEEVDLIVTCDCGISNHQEISRAKELGMQVIVTDHHHLPEELPPADAIITPKLLAEEHRAHNIPGAGMAYFLLLGLLMAMDRAQEAEEYLDLVSLAVVADVVPLQAENRYLLQKGLPRLAGTHRPGLLQLFDICGIDPEEIDEETIGFQIAPRLNATGRIESAEVGVELLLAPDQETARGLARRLDLINTKRRELNEKMQEEAEALLGDNFKGGPVILYQPHWHEGVQGITASKLSETYYAPALMMSLKEDGKTITGSARSIPGIHIYDALKECAEFLDKFGGHAGAAGFSLQRDKLLGFEKSMEQILRAQMANLGGVQEIKVDGILPLSQITPKLYQEMQKLAPFGEANRVPKFLCPEAEVVYHRPTSNDKHLRMIFKEEEAQFPAIWWWNGGAEFDPVVDLVYSIGLNRWQGKEEIQLLVDQLVNRIDMSKEMAAPEEVLEFALEDRRKWRELGEELPRYENAVYFVEGGLARELASGQFAMASESTDPPGKVEKSQSSKTSEQTKPVIAGQAEGISKSESSQTSGQSAADPKVASASTGVRYAPPLQTMHRYQFIQAGTLVLLTIPPGLRVFKELIYMVRPKKVILAYSARNLRSDVEFVKEMVGILKFIIEHQKGKTDIYQLSTRLTEMENTITAGLKFLEEKGMIDVEFINPETLRLHKGAGRAKRHLEQQQKRLLALLRESRAFRKYLLESTPEKIQKLIQDV